MAPAVKSQGDQMDMGSLATLFYSLLHLIDSSARLFESVERTGEKS